MSNSDKAGSELDQAIRARWARALKIVAGAYDDFIEDDDKRSDWTLGSRCETAMVTKTYDEIGKFEVLEEEMKAMTSELKGDK